MPNIRSFAHIQFVIKAASIYINEGSSSVFYVKVLQFTRYELSAYQFGEYLSTLIEY